MARHSKRKSPESSDDEAPEAVSFGSSKKVAKDEQHAVQQHHAMQKQKQKERNRAIDRTLKERSTHTEAKTKASDLERRPKEAEVEPSEDEESGLDDPEAESEDDSGPGRKELEARMARAMMEAEDESGSEEEVEGFERFGKDVDMDGGDEDEEDTSVDGGEDGNEEGAAAEKEGEEDEDEEMASDEDEDEDEAPSTQPSSSSRKANYLPDHLFKSALAQAGKKIVFADETAVPSPIASSPPRKRKRTKHRSKDILLGSRTIRTLSKPTAVASAAAKGLAPPRRVDRFVKASLNLKGDTTKAKSKGWIRRPANLGVMKRNGPAAHFVRTS